jgi:hypothetical protein
MVVRQDGWYGVRCVFRLRGAYEERIAVWRARSFEHSVELAEREAAVYAERHKAEYLGFCDSYFIDKEIFELDQEVFSLLRDSDLEPEEYVRAVFVSGQEADCPTALAADGDHWHGVRCLFRWPGWEGWPYEERVTLWRASSLESAVGLAAAEAAQYAAESEERIEYLGVTQGYGPCEGDEVADGMVVFALVRASPLPPEEYLDAFFDTGEGRSREIEAHRPA